ncbi:MAG TPA: NTP transferase domain-containing protein [Opitutaceae bacterium]|jgi:NDP-sugar pyrophosphorylase family protein
MELVILAAGMGSRYGGLKQVDPMGPGGETVLDYAVYDARRAGFSRVVFVIRKDFEDIFKEKVGSRCARLLDVAYAYQELTDLPGALGGRPLADERPKPWGTGHAVWCARHAVREPFAVINADDFYGEDSFRRLAGFLKTNPGTTRYAMVGFRLDQTLSEHGAVSRGVASVRDGRLVGLEERSGILSADVGRGAYRGDEIVSMNCWGFQPGVFAQLGEQFAQFLVARGADPKAEFYLPAAIASLVATGQAEVEILPTNSRWFGVTFREDRPGVVKAIDGLIRSGGYPPSIF